MTQQEAADASGVTRASWSTWEGGSVPHRQVEVTRKIAAGLGYDVSWLLFGGPLRNEHEGPSGPSGNGRPRQDSNLRPADYAGTGRSISLFGPMSERRRNHRSTYPDRRAA